jgi:hypothetical protein
MDLNCIPLDSEKVAQLQLQNCICTHGKCEEIYKSLNRKSEGEKCLGMSMHREDITLILSYRNRGTCGLTYMAPEENQWLAQ